ncbi:MAG: ATP synthase F1 subunit delta [Armatimonadetes bacterium]|nr:ATP synthase F1 subunit delta [Armatimonadota bacterium]
MDSESQIWESEALAKNFWLVRRLTLPTVKEVEKLAKVLSGWKARRYSGALLQAAIKANEVERIEAEVKALAEMLNRSPQLVKFLAQPLVPFSEKSQRLKQRLKGRVSPVTLNFLLTVVKNKRIEAFEHIVKVFIDLVREYRGEVLAEVTSAVPLTDEERAMTVQRLQEITGKKILLSEKVDPNIVGGMRIIVGDKLLDLSLKGHLERIRERLRQVFVAAPAEVTIAETTFNDPQKNEKGKKDGAL